MVKKTAKRARKNSPKKYTSRKKPRVNYSETIETLKKRVEALELEKSNQPNNVQLINHPVSGHVEAGSKWSETPKGQQWKKEIDYAQELLDNALNQKGYDMSASGVYARKLAGLLRKNPQISEQYIEEIVQEIIEKQKQSAAKKTNTILLEPKSLKRLVGLRANNNIGDPQQIQEDPQIGQQQNYPKPLIGGFFDDSSDDE